MPCFAIERMNDFGIENYTIFRTLARWNRTLAKHRQFFCSTSEVKVLIPAPFFRDNPDSLDAFKKHGVAHIQDLSIKTSFQSFCQKQY